MDNFSYTFGYMMERATNMVAYCMFAAVVAKPLEAERQKIKAALGHDPDQENWQDYYELQQAQANRQKTHQREIDREKLRRLVFGEDSGSLETK